MKKTVKFLSGTALVVAIAFAGLTSFNTPDPIGEDCGCPTGWYLQQFNKKTNPNLVQWDKNDDDLLCRKDMPENSKGKGNNRGGQGPRVYKDNKLCD